MTTRKKIGLVYINDPGWSGGMDYVVNLVNALAILPEEKQPLVRLFVEEGTDLEALSKRLKYRYFKFKLVRRYSKCILSYLLNFTRKFRSDLSDLDLVYPFPKQDFYSRYFNAVPSSRKVFWIPDFQEEHYPQFFSSETLGKRRKSRSDILLNPSNRVVFSSNSALQDMRKFYPESKAKPTVLKFANPLGITRNYFMDMERLAHFGVETHEYFISPNQFWKHKNHNILIEAVSLLKMQGKSVSILLTGREEESRDPHYFPALKAKVVELGLTKQIRFLGFLPKDDLYTLLAHAKALIQPSLFEGWSTTIEDAIALNVPVVCSDLKVNREQLGESAIFFDPKDAAELARILTRNEMFTPPGFDVKKRVMDFANNFLNLTEVIVNRGSSYM
jgi:glycosyltransferase involved in cell wall biosynthesis